MGAPASTTEKRERYEALVAEAERLIRERPRAYRRRLALLALLGYAVVFGVLLALLVLIAGSIAGAIASTVVLVILIKYKLVFVLAVMAWVLAKALWVRFEAPSGLPVPRDAAPRLHAELDGLRRALDTPPIHRVLLTEDFNAGIAQTPRLGVLGWHRNTLLLGVPLLVALTPDEARAVLAHELGHLSRNHSRFNAWIYRVRATWYRIMVAFDNAQGWAVSWIRRFFDWYAPYFDAMSFALARANEYEADAVAAALTSPPAAASALVGTTLRDGISADGYWARLIARADREPEPEPRPWRGLARFHREHRPDDGEIARRLRDAMALEADHSDTHPALKDRLAALGEPARATFAVDQSAARAWLGDRLDDVLDAFDREWLARNADPWRERFREQEAERERLAALRARERASLAPLELWELAALTERHGDAAEALALYRAYQGREPHDLDADFTIGRLLLERDDDAGIACLERAAARFDLALAAIHLVFSFHLRRGDAPAAERWRRRGERQADLEARARVERAALHAKDRYEASGLDDAALAALRGQLESRSDVRRAWIARKHVEVAPESPLYVLAVKPRGWFRNAGKITAALAEEVQLPGEGFFVAAAGDTADIAARVRKAGERVL